MFFYSEEDVDKQIEIVEQAIEEKPDVILLAAVDKDKLLPVAKKIKEAGIGLIVIDSGLSEDIADCFVGTDNVAAARSVGEECGVCRALRTLRLR